MAVAAAVVVGGCTITYWLWKCSEPEPGKVAALQCEVDNGDAVQPPRELSPPVAGFLVAAVKPEDGFAGFIPEDTEADGPPSTDEEEDDDESLKAPAESFGRRKPREDSFNDSWAAFGGKKEAREGSFRKRSAEKEDRAQTIKAKCAPPGSTIGRERLPRPTPPGLTTPAPSVLSARLRHPPRCAHARALPSAVRRSSSLASHLCTPQQHNRKVENLLEKQLRWDPQVRPTRRLQWWALRATSPCQRGPCVGSAFQCWPLCPCCSAMHACRRAMHACPWRPLVCRMPCPRRTLPVPAQTPPPPGSRTVATSHRSLKERPEWASERGAASGKRSVVQPIPEFGHRAAATNARLEPIVQSSPEEEEQSEALIPASREMEASREAAALLAQGTRATKGSKGSRAKADGDNTAQAPSATPPSSAGKKHKKTGKSLGGFDSISQLSKPKR